MVKLDQQVNTKNPNIGRIVKFEGIRLPFEPLLWPQLEVQITDEGNVLGLSGCEQCYTTIALFNFASDFLTEKDINYARAQMNKN